MSDSKPENPSGIDPALLPASPGTRQAWDVSDLPAPPDFNFRNIVRVIGPGAIVLSMSIGLGEWVLGPLVVTQYGFTMLWVVTVAIILQLVLNLEFIRYTVYTGEPVINGFLRLAPHPLFWGGIYILLSLFHTGWPAWAAASAAPLFAGFTGHLPGPGDESVMRWLGIMNLLICAVIVAFGGKVERTLEIVNWFMVLFVFGFLFFVCLLIVPAETWWAGILGFFGMTPGFEFLLIPEDVSWILVGGFAAFAGAGGIANLTVSNYMRDKGIGMGSKVGYIPALIGGRKVVVSPIGSVFPATETNLARWRIWWQYVRCDQILVWAAGCFVGMFLNCILAAHIIPAGTELSGLSIGAFQAEFLAREGGELLGFVTLVNGFWILFGSQLVTIDLMARINTDLIWSMSRTRQRHGGQRYPAPVLFPAGRVRTVGVYCHQPGPAEGAFVDFLQRRRFHPGRERYSYPDPQPQGPAPGRQKPPLGAQPGRLYGLVLRFLLRAEPAGTAGAVVA